MTTLKAKSVSLYLEGLMILTFDRQARLLEAAPLSQVGHSLAGVIYRRQFDEGGTPGAWQGEDYDPFARSDIQEFDTGRIFIETGKSILDADASLSETPATVDTERWDPFSAIPDLEKEFFGQAVTLKHDNLKPSLRISNGAFHSVFLPDHPGAKVAPVIVESLLVERDALKNLRTVTSIPISADEIKRRLGPARKSLGIKSYTAAMRLDLTQEQNLVCQLEKSAGAGSIEVLRIEYDRNFELRMAIRNFPIEKDHESKEPGDDPIHTFHSLNFYGAVEGSVATRFMLSDEGKQRKYVNREKVEFGRDAEPETGGGNPCCPLGWRLGEITG